MPYTPQPIGPLTVSRFLEGRWHCMDRSRMIENKIHSWTAHPSQASFNLPLLRLWRSESLSVENMPHFGQSLFAEKPIEYLHERETRVATLNSFVGSNNMAVTSFLGFTTNPSKLQALDVDTHGNGGHSKRKRRRAGRILVVVEPMTRVRNGRPILNVAAEMRHYGIPVPEGKSIEFYEDQYVCLWEVPKQEVVGTWKWKELTAHDGDWYQDIIIPAYTRFRDERDEIDTAAEAERHSLPWPARLYQTT
ncbi:hypothetical protein VTO42DRAFT_759 [Malbranchea cinnamomea]